MSLIDALLAMTILAVVMLGVTYATTAGHQHLQHGDAALRSVRLAEQLMEEIISRPYHGSGGTARSTWVIADYDGFTEQPGNLRDFAGEACDAEDQRFGRSVGVEPVTHTLAGLGGFTVSGLRITVTVTSPRGQQQAIQRFVPEPMQ